MSSPVRESRLGEKQGTKGCEIVGERARPGDARTYTGGTVIDAASERGAEMRTFRPVVGWTSDDAG